MKKETIFGMGGVIVIIAVLIIAASISCMSSINNANDRIDTFNEIIGEYNDRIETLEDRINTLEDIAVSNGEMWDKQMEINQGIIDIIEILIS